MKARTMGEAVLLLAGLRAFAEGKLILHGMHIDPCVDGQTVMLRCGKNVVFAPIPVGVTFDELMCGSVDWFNPESPLERMAAEGNA
jgi:hypothetical protein